MGNIAIGLPSSIATPPAGQVTEFFDTTTLPAVHSYMDENRDVFPFPYSSGAQAADACVEIAKDLVDDIGCAVKSGVILMSELNTFVKTGLKVSCAATDDGAGNTTSSVTIENLTVPVASITVLPTTINPLAVGASALIVPTILPANASNKNVFWTTSNAAKATISSTGIVTGIAAGSATITATTIDGSFTALTSVTVV